MLTPSPCSKGHICPQHRPWDNPDLSFPRRCPGFITAPSAPPRVSWLGVVSNPNHLLFLCSSEAFLGPGVGPGGLGFQRCRRPQWEPVMGSHVMPHPSQGLSQAPCNRWPSAPAACDEVMGGALETPLDRVGASPTGLGVGPCLFTPAPPHSVLGAGVDRVEEQRSSDYELVVVSH